MVIKLAVRNLMLHRVKTFIIGSLVVLGVLLSFVGTSLIDQVSANLERVFVDQFTGDLLIRSSKQLAGVFGASGDVEEASGPPVIAPLPHHTELMEALQQRSEIKRLTRLFVGYVMPNLAEINTDFFLVWGVSPQEFFEFFPTLKLVEGRLLQEGERGIMLHANIRKNLEENYRVSLAPGQSIQLNNFGVGGIKIRTLPIVGIFEYPMGNDRFFIPNFIDVETARMLFHQPTASELTVNLDPQATSLLTDVSEDELFGSEDIVVIPPSSRRQGEIELELKPINTNQSAPNQSASSGAWTTVLLRLKEGTNAEAFSQELNDLFNEKKWDLFAQSWFASATPDSWISMGLRFLLGVLVFLIGVVSVIVMMNTLIASVMERTPELGTMRALGARRSFIAKMLFVETLVLVVVSGLVAIGLSLILFALLSVIGIPAPDPNLEAYFGGKVFRPTASSGAFVGAFSIMAQIVFFSWIFPVLSAVKISPLKAMGTE